MADVFGLSDWEYFEELCKRFYIANKKVGDYVIGDTEGYPDRMTKEQLNADKALGEMESAFSELKNLMYYALKCEPDSTHALTGVRNMLSDARDH